MSRKVTAARMHGPGGGVFLDEVDLADPRHGEVVVEMSMAGVNPLDGYVLAGRVGGDAAYPRTLGVEGVGEHEGRLVVVFGSGVGIVRDGTWSSAALLPATALVEVPAGVPEEVASACGVVGSTAIRVVDDLARAGRDDRVLVLGASGAVGSAACSLLSAGGIAVWGQTTSEGKAINIEQRGAVPIIAATPEDLSRMLFGHVEPTVVLDSLGDAWTAVAVHALGMGGRLVSYGTSAGVSGELDLQAIYRKGITWYGYGGMAESQDRLRDAVGRALDAVSQGRLTIVTQEPLPLTRAQEALDRVSRREGFGKVLLDLRAG